MKNTTKEHSEILKSYYDEWEEVNKNAVDYIQSLNGNEVVVSDQALNNGTYYTKNDFLDIVRGFSPIGRKLALAIHDNTNGNPRFDDIFLPIKSGDPIFKVFPYLRPVAQDQVLDSLAPPSNITEEELCYTRDLLWYKTTASNIPGMTSSVVEELNERLSNKRNKITRGLSYIAIIISVMALLVSIYFNIISIASNKEWQRQQIRLLEKDN